MAGHSVVPDTLLGIARVYLKEAEDSELINSYYVFNAGDDLELLMTLSKGENDEEIHRLAWDTFKAVADKAKVLKLYGAGQDQVFYSTPRALSAGEHGSYQRKA